MTRFLIVYIYHLISLGQLKYEHWLLHLAPIRKQEICREYLWRVSCKIDKDMGEY
jgi:hypothetical protein